ncbi:MAG: toll/interleukin-1 receptor domain-containing protein [Anaerolineae bacterium]|nr:toll/interleukin-1 receptor domain-containing protein [Anaerolineae bacterium]
MLRMIYTADDRALAERIATDLRAAGYEVGEGAPARGDLIVIALSPAALNDDALQAKLVTALDLNLHVIPVMTQPVRLPKLIDHLDVVSFADGYDFAVLRQQVDRALSGDAPLPVRVLTPSIRRSNRTAGIVVGIAALVMFVAGLYGVGVLGIQAPVEEFNGEETMFSMTRDVIAAPELEIYAQFLPKTTEEAANYIPTLLAVPTVYRPLVAMTATAVAAEPQPTESPDSDG